MERIGEIKAAIEKLEEHSADYEALAEDDRAYVEACQNLFEQEMFVPLRCTAEEVKEALKAVGFQPGMMGEDEFVQKIREAILHLADEKRRRRLAMELSMLLPDLVAQGRFRDAWVVWTCVEMTEEDANESNPFLFHMFAFGHDALIAQQEAKRARMLDELGIEADKANTLSFDEINALINRRLDDPASRARMESLLAANPEEHAEALDTVERIERAFFEFAKSDEGAPLRLRDEELEPVLPGVLQRLNRWAINNPELLARRDEASAMEVLRKAFTPAIADIARAIFTGKRISELESALLKIREEKLASNDIGLAAAINAALHSLREREDPAENMFLRCLCQHSLRQAIQKSEEASKEGKAGLKTR